MKDSEFKFRLPDELRVTFLRTCAENDQPAAQVLRAAVRAYIAENGATQGDLLKPAKTRRKGLVGDGK